VGNFKIPHDAKEAARASMPMVRAQRRRDEIRDEIQQQRDEMRDEPPVQKARSFHHGRNRQQFLPLDWAFDAATIATGLGLVCPPDTAPCPSDAALWERLCFAA
jgi:hypothetical protein